MQLMREGREMIGHLYMGCSDMLVGWLVSPSLPIPFKFRSLLPYILGRVYTTVEKASGRSRMLGQDMVIWGKWWMCRKIIEDNKIFLLSWASLASWGQTRNSSGEAQLQKVPPRRWPCHSIIHEKSSPPLFSSPSVNTHRSRVAFFTNHNWETPFFSWPVDFSTVV
jgi:hypothetical protein